MEQNNELSAFQSLLDAGFPAWQIADQVTKHLQALQNLPASTDGRADAIERAKAFLEKIPPLERVPAGGSA